MERDSLVTRIDDYLRAWNERDAHVREALLRVVWSEGARFSDVRFACEGVARLSAYMAACQARTRGAHVMRSSDVDAFGNVARYTWRVLGGGPEGVDIVTVTPEGRIGDVVSLVARWAGGVSVGPHLADARGVG